MNKTMGAVLLLALCLTLAPDAYGNVVFVRSKVLITYLADGNRAGGCMVKLEADLPSKGLNCPSPYVSFSCSGDFNSKDIAFHMFETAQLAQATGMEIAVYVDDTKKHGGNCYANGLFLLSTP